MAYIKVLWKRSPFPFTQLTVSISRVRPRMKESVGGRDCSSVVRYFPVCARTWVQSPPVPPSKQKINRGRVLDRLWL